MPTKKQLFAAVKAFERTAGKPEEERLSAAIDAAFRVDTADALTVDACSLVDEWDPSLKIDTSQPHQEYMACVLWWFKRATPEYWADLKGRYPDCDVKQTSRDLYLWLSTHPDRISRRKSLHLTLSVTWLGRQQKKIERTREFNRMREQASKRVAL